MENKKENKKEQEKFDLTEYSKNTLKFDDKKAKLLSMELKQFAEQYLNDTNLNSMSVINTLALIIDTGMSINPKKREAYLVAYGNNLTIIFTKTAYLKAIKTHYPNAKVNVSNIVEGEIKKFNPITGNYELKEMDFDERQKLKTVGYLGTLDIGNNNIFQVYMTMKELEEFENKYSKAGWKKMGRENMIYKTIIKQIFYKNSGILPILDILSNDMSTKTKDNEIIHLDNPIEEKENNRLLDKPKEIEIDELDGEF